MTQVLLLQLTLWILFRIRYSANDAEDGAVTLIYSDLVSDYIGSFRDGGDGIINLVFTLKKPIKGIYTFTLLDMELEAEERREGDLAIHLEFIKYGPAKKVY